MLIDQTRPRNPTASVSTSPGSILRDGDFTGDASRFGARIKASRNRQRVARTSAYVGTMQSKYVATDISTAVVVVEGVRLEARLPAEQKKPSPVAVNGGKPRSEFEAKLEAVRKNSALIDHVAIGAKHRRQIKAILSI